MNRTNKLLNKIKDDEINHQKTSKKSSSTISKSQLTEDNLDDYLRTVKTDEHSKKLIEKYLNNKESW